MILSFTYRKQNVFGRVKLRKCLIKIAAIYMSDLKNSKVTLYKMSVSMCTFVCVCLITLISHFIPENPISNVFHVS